MSSNQVAVEGRKNLHHFQNYQNQAETVPLKMTGVCNFGVPKKESAWFLRETNFYRILQKSNYVQLLEKKVNVSHLNYLTFFLTGITMACFDANGIGGVTFGLLNPDNWRGMWIAFTFAAVVHYLHRNIESFRITGVLTSNKYSAMDNFKSALNEECESFSTEKIDENLVN